LRESDSLSWPGLEAGGDGTPYSNDLRERVVACVEQGGLSRHEAAARFGVAISTAILWVRRFRATGGVAPGQMGGRKLKVSAASITSGLSAAARSGILRCAGLCNVSEVVRIAQAEERIGDFGVEINPGVPMIELASSRREIPSDFRRWCPW
jgi:transposase